MWLSTDSPCERHFPHRGSVLRRGLGQLLAKGDVFELSAFGSDRHRRLLDRRLRWVSHLTATVRVTLAMGALGAGGAIPSLLRRKEVVGAPTCLLIKNTSQNWPIQLNVVENLIHLHASALCGR
jgi:hypothetical protein